MQTGNYKNVHKTDTNYKFILNLKKIFIVRLCHYKMNIFELRPVKLDHIIFDVNVNCKIVLFISIARSVVCKHLPTSYIVCIEAQIIEINNKKHNSTTFCALTKISEVHANM